MTINDQIKDEKLHYDINREAAKILALSSGKIHKYEYLTGKDILPSNKQQIIEQAKFTSSPLGKAFKKQIKTIEDQEERQIDALKDLKPKKQTKAITYKSDDGDDDDDDDDDDKTSISKEIYNEILGQRIDEILQMSKGISHSGLVHDFKGPTPSINSGKYGGQCIFTGI